MGQNPLTRCPSFPVVLFCSRQFIRGHHTRNSSSVPSTLSHDSAGSLKCNSPRTWLTSCASYPAESAAHIQNIVRAFDLSAPGTRFCFSANSENQRPLGERLTSCASSPAESSRSSRFSSRMSCALLIFALAAAGASSSSAASSPKESRARFLNEGKVGLTFVSGMQCIGTCDMYILPLLS
jgi:hypothetical protein